MHYTSFRKTYLLLGFSRTQHSLIKIPQPTNNLTVTQQCSAVFEGQKVLTNMQKLMQRSERRKKKLTSVDSAFNLKRKNIATLSYSRRIMIRVLATKQWLYFWVQEKRFHSWLEFYVELIYGQLYLWKQAITIYNDKTWLLAKRVSIYAQKTFLLFGCMYICTLNTDYSQTKDWLHACTETKSHLASFQIWQLWLALLHIRYTKLSVTWKSWWI